MKSKTYLLVFFIVCACPLIFTYNAHAVVVKGSIHVVASSHELIGLAYTQGPRGIMMISYQIPPLNPDDPQFYLPFGVASRGANSPVNSRHVILDTKIYMVNTSNDTLEMKFLFFDHEGNRITQARFVLGPHEALHKSVFHMLYPHTAGNGLPEPPAPPQRP